MKVAVISGTNRGTGRTLAKELADGGYWVIGLNRSLAGDDWQHEIECDLRDSRQIAAALTCLKQQVEQIDVLVHNSAMRTLGPLTEISQDEWEDVFRVNVHGVLALTMGCLPLLEKAEGTIVIMGSQAGTQLTEHIGSYCVSKAALHALAGIMLREFRQQGIRTILVIPHAIANEDDDDLPFRMTRESVSSCIVQLLATPASITPSIIELRPTRPVKMGVKGLRMLQYSL